MNRRSSRVRRRYIAGVALCSLAAASFAATALPAAAAPPADAAAVAAVDRIVVEPVRIQAEDYTGDNGGGLKKESSTDETGQSLGNVGGTWSGGEIVFDAVSLGSTPLSTLTVRYVNNSGRVGQNAALTFYLDDVTEAGELVTVPLPVTGSSWNAYSTTTVELPEKVSGDHTLVVAMHADTDSSHPYVGNLDYFEFGPEALPDSYLTTDDEWRYSDNGTDPSGDGSLSWTTADFDDSAWKQAAGSFGSKRGEADLGGGFVADTLIQYTQPGSTDTIPTYHFRNEIDVSAEQLGQLDGIEGTITYDDAVRIYVNGEKVAGFVDDRVETAANQNLTYAGASNGNPRTSTFTIPVEGLDAGENTIAVALYQDRETSSDIYLDLTSLVPAVHVPEPDEATISDIVLGVGATESERNLAWYSDIDVEQVAQIAPAADVDGDTFPASATTVATSKSGGTSSGEYFRDASFTGLAENTEYAYRVGSDEKGWSSVHTFRTQDFDGDFSFLFFGDPQLGASGNVDNDGAGWADTLEVATQSYPDAEMLFSAGDQVDSAPNERQYELFLAPEPLQSIPFVATNGNHDVGSKAYEQHFNLPNEDLTAGAGGSSWSGGDYWFIYKDVLFVNINSNSRDYASHNAFMDKVIAEQGDKAKWRVLAFHHSIYSMALHIDDGDINDRRVSMPEKISELDFDAVLMGHDHNYTRTYLIKDGAMADASEVPGQAKVEAKDGEVLYVTASSASGSKYYSTKQNPSVDPWWPSVNNEERVRQYTAVEVTDGDITFRTMRSQANGTARPVNSVVDEVVLTKDAAPEITVPDGVEITIGDDFDALEGVSAVDNVDGDLTDDLVVTGAVDSTTAGSYTLTYTVSDARGNEAVATRTVTVIAETEEPGTEEPGTEEPGTGEPGTEEPGTEEPGTEEPGTEEPGTEEPGTEEPGTEEPGTEEPGTEEPGTEEPGTEEPGTEEPGTEEPGTEEPGTEEPGTDKPDFTPSAPVTDGADLPASLEDVVTAAVDGRTVRISGLTAGEWYFGYVYSTPTALGWMEASATATATGTLPDSLEAGTHRIAVLDADGMIVGWTEFILAADAAPASGGLASTGSTFSAGWGFATGGALLLAAGGALLVARRRAASSR